MSTKDDARSLVGTYILKKFNETSVQEDECTLELSLEGSENDLRAHAKVANCMNGTLRFKDGKLFGDLMSTMMMGPPFLMQIEDVVGVGFSNGMKALREGETLTLSYGNDTLQYVLNNTTTSSANRA